MEQVLYQLPEGWKWETLTDVTQFIGGSQPPKSEFSDTAKDGYVRLIQIRDYKTDAHIVYVDRNSTKKFCNRDDVMIGRYGPPVFQILRGLEGAYNVALMKAVPDEKILSKDYLFAFLQSSPIQSYIVGLSQRAAGQSGVNKKALENYSIPIPPMAEQKRIIEKLDALLTRIDTAIEHLQQSVTLADALYASSLDQVFEKVYLDYSTKPLSVLASKIGSGATPKGGQKAYKESGISLIRSLNVYDSEFKPEGLAFIDDDQAEKLSNVVVEEGDVLLNITGASIARCCVAPVELLPARVNQHVCIIRPNEELNSTYLNYLLISPKFKAALLFQGAGGATRQALTKVMVSNLEIPLPPLEMQAELVGKVNLFSQKNRALKEQVNSKISDLITLKASILDSAFKGEV